MYVTKRSPFRGIADPAGLLAQVFVGEGPAHYRGIDLLLVPTARSFLNSVQALTAVSRLESRIFVPFQHAMSIFELYSQSQRPAPESFVYDQFPKELKVQCKHIWNEFFLKALPDGERTAYYQRIVRVLLKEHALDNLPTVLHQATLLDRINIYFEQSKDVNQALDVVQLLCFSMEHVPDFLYSKGYQFVPADTGPAAIAEINERFRRRGIGYQYTQGRIIRLDNQLLHQEAVDKPLQLLTDPMYENVNREFLTAHDHFRHGRNEDCLTWALKAFESVMKVVADANGWPYDKGATARPLVQLLFAQGFFPAYFQSAMAGIQTFLENSINTIRNKKGGHGSGSEVNEVPDSLAQYMLYITGVTINWIVEIQRERKPKP